MAEALSGIIDRVTFHNTDTGYAVLRVTARGHRDPVTIVGLLPQATNLLDRHCIRAGDRVVLIGDFVRDQAHA